MSVHVLEYTLCPILEQLRIEEALLRNDDRNWLLINRGSAPAIVMGISGKPHDLLHLEKVNCPLIRRYSGGGTVVVDHNTLFVSLIGNKSWLDCPAFPRDIMQWSLRFYQHIPLVALRENDYVIGNRKFGGNAQSITKDRFVHHTTLLWDYCPHNMALLKLPKNRPNYREQRGHEEFVCRLSEVVETQNQVVDGVKNATRSMYGLELGAIEGVLDKPHRQTTHELIGL